MPSCVLMALMVKNGSCADDERNDPPVGIVPVTLPVPRCWRSLPLVADDGKTARVVNIAARTRGIAVTAASGEEGEHDHGQGELEPAPLARCARLRHSL